MHMYVADANVCTCLFLCLRRTCKPGLREQCDQPDQPVQLAEATTNMCGVLMSKERLAVLFTVFCHASLFQIEVEESLTITDHKGNDHGHLQVSKACHETKNYTTFCFFSFSLHIYKSRLSRKFTFNFPRLSI